MVTNYINYVNKSRLTVVSSVAKKNAHATTTESLFTRTVMPWMVPPKSVPPDHLRQVFVAVDGPPGPSTAATDGPPGPSTAP